MKLPVDALRYLLDAKAPAEILLKYVSAYEPISRVAQLFKFKDMISAKEICAQGV